jgi:putative SOS response-associated peptidase YedK
MPVILDDEGEDRWLAGELGDLVAPCPAQLMMVEQHEPKRKESPQEEFTQGGDALAERE